MGFDSIIHIIIFDKDASCLVGLKLDGVNLFVALLKDRADMGIL